jgi:hypothetical protein
VEIGVEEAVDHRLAKEGADERLGKRLEIVPASTSASRSVSLMPSIHSSVITRRALRLQSISGTKKPLSATMPRAARRRSGLAPKVELAHRPLPEMRDDEPRAEPRALARPMPSTCAAAHS